MTNSDGEYVCLDSKLHRSSFGKQTPQEVTVGLNQGVARDNSLFKLSGSSPKSEGTLENDSKLNFHSKYPESQEAQMIASFSALWVYMFFSVCLERARHYTLTMKSSEWQGLVILS